MKRIRMLVIAVLFTAGVGLATIPPATAASAAAVPAPTGPSGIGMPLGLNHAGTGPLVNSTYYQRALKSPKWARTPSGLVFKSCVYQVPNGTKVDSIHNRFVMPNGTVRPVKACAYPRLVKSVAVHATVGTAAPVAGTNGWLQSFQQQGLPALGYLYVKNAAPSAPTQGSSESDFAFSGLQPSNGSAILQPVIGWGGVYTGKNGTGTSNGSGNYVWMASYYYWSGNAVAGAFRGINPADTIEASIAASSCGSGGGGCTWDIYMYDDNTGASSDLVVGSSPAYPWLIGGAFESYNATNCNMLFANHHLVWRALNVLTATGAKVTPSFSKVVSDQECSMNTTYSSTGGDITWTP